MMGIARSYCSTALVLATACLLVGTPAWARTGPRLDKAPDYTKGERPATMDTAWAIGPTGARGVFYYNDARQVLIPEVGSIDKGSPAEGNLREGDVIIGVLSPTTGQDVGNGKFTFDARRSMAIAIEEAEKKEHGGKLVLNVWRPNGKIVTTKKKHSSRYTDPKDGKRKSRYWYTDLYTFQPDEPLSGKVMPVTLTLPVMGSYSATSPYACEKNEALVKKLVANILKNGLSSNISANFDALGLLATGDKAHLPLLQDYARKVAAECVERDALGKGRGSTWSAAYENLFLCEYYLITKDEQVLPGIKAMSMYLARGVSGVGTWSHGCASVKENGMYGPATAYGAMNQISMVCAMTLVLAQKCGIEDPFIDKAVRLALDFTRFYVDKGVIPYGDHSPAGGYDNNGRNSIAAVLYDLAGDKKSAEYFTKMTLASYQTREGGHTGHFFSWNWGGLGAARGGPEAAASFLKNTRYFFELERRYDGKCVYQPQLPGDAGKTKGFTATGQRLIQCCLPRKQLYITGKGGSCVPPITGKELESVVYAPLFKPEKFSTQQLLKALGFWAIPVRQAAAYELGKRDDNVVEELIAMLDSPNRYARYGACVGLYNAGRESTKAVDKLIDIIENNDDMTLRYYAMNALYMPSENMRGKGHGLGDTPRRATTALLKLAAVYDPVQDPTRKIARQVSHILFHGDTREHIPQAFFPKARGAEELDMTLLRPALKALLLNPNGEARSMASAVLPQLSIEDLEPLWAEIYQSTTTLAPSGVMFARGAHQNGIKTMAIHKVKEGLDYGAWFCLYKDGWGNYDRKRKGPEVLLPYGRALEPYFKDIENVIAKHVKGAGKAWRYKELEAARKAPMPELISIEKYIKTKPEKQYLDWKAGEKQQQEEEEELGEGGGE